MSNFRIRWVFSNEVLKTLDFGIFEMEYPYPKTSFKQEI